MILLKKALSAVWLQNARFKIIDPKTKKGRPKAAYFYLLGLQKPVGAGEAIRTPDPNLGKVMLYP